MKQLSGKGHLHFRQVNRVSPNKLNSVRNKRQQKGGYPLPPQFDRFKLAFFIVLKMRLKSRAALLLTRDGVLRADLIMQKMGDYNLC